MRHRIAGRARFTSAASATQDGGSSRNGATRVHPIGVPAAHSAAGNGTMFPRQPLLFGRGIFRRLCWRSRGPSSSSGVALTLGSPWRVLSWTAPAARSLFARKENGGLGSTPLGGGKTRALRAHREAGPRMARNPRPAAHGRTPPSPPAAVIFRPAPCAELLLGARNLFPAGESPVPARGGNPACTRFREADPSGGFAASPLYTRGP